MKARSYLTLLIVPLAAALLVFIVYAVKNSSQRQDLYVLTAQAAKRSFAVTVETVGELDAARSKMLCSEIRGDRAKIIFLIEDGSRVKKGDVLVRFDRTPFEEELNKFKAKVGECEAVIEALWQVLELEKTQVEQEIRTAGFELRSAELDLKKLRVGDGPLELARLEFMAQKVKQEYEEINGYVGDLESLAKRGYANPTEIEQAKNKTAEVQRAYEMAKRQHETYRDYVLPSLLEKARSLVEQRKQELKQTKKSAGFKVGKAMAALRKAERELESDRATLTRAKTELGRTIIRAPIPGLVVLREEYRGGERRKPQIGDVVWQNQPLLYLPDISSMIVKTKIREVDLHKVAVGKRATVGVDAYPDLLLSGEVRSIGVLAESKVRPASTNKYFQVIVAVKGSEERLRPGMTARVMIHCTEVKNTLSVPIQALFEEDRKYYCYVHIDASFEKREVHIGQQNIDWIEIEAGLTEGEDIALSMPPIEEIKRERALEKGK